jgi:cysteine desulfurase
VPVGPAVGTALLWFARCRTVSAQRQWQRDRDRNVTASIDLDANATTPVLPAVWEAMRPWMLSDHGNPASAHRLGAQARRALEEARDTVARLLGAEPKEVVFTSGATESNNLAVFGLLPETGGHVLVSPIEHPSVLEPIRRLGDRHDIGYLKVNSHGLIDPESVTCQLREDTTLVAAMLVNHETGAVQQIASIVRKISNRVPLHCDAAQGVGKIPVHFHELGAATLSLSAHKFHGPPGIGVLLVRRGVKLRPLFHGGHQQQGRRPGSEPVALAVGLACALELACRELSERYEKICRLRELLVASWQEDGIEFVINGPQESSGEGIPHVLNVSFPGCNADALLMRLDLAGIACSTGSACSSGSLLPSPVLEAMHVPQDRLRSAMRFSFSHLLEPRMAIEAGHRIANVAQSLRHIASAGDIA